jgi:hypothetical protein
MRTRVFIGAVCLALLVTASSAWAANVGGVVSDATGAAVPGATVVLRELATGREQRVTTGVDGKYAFDTAETGTFLVLVTRQGFSEAARTVIVSQPEQKIVQPSRRPIRSQRVMPWLRWPTLHRSGMVRSVCGRGCAGWIPHACSCWWMASG